MAGATGADLLAVLGGERLPAVAVFFGDEPWFAEEGIRAVRRGFLGDDGEGYLSYEGPTGPRDREGKSLLEAIEEGRTVPMFGGRQVVAWRGRSLADEEVAALAGLAGSSPAFLRVVVRVGSLGAGAQKKLAKAGVALGNSRKLFDTPWPGRPEFQTPLNQWACERARHHRLRVDIRTAHVLTGAVGNDLAGVDSHLERLSVLLGDGAEVTEDDLAPILGAGRDFDAFAFGDAIYRRDTAKAFRVARNAFREGIEDQRGKRSRDGGYVAGRLIWSASFTLERVYEAARLLADGRSPAEAEAAIGKGRPSPVAKRAVEMARGFDLAALRNHYVWLARAEADTRTALPPEVVVESLIPRLTGAANG